MQSLEAHSPAQRQASNVTEYRKVLATGCGLAEERNRQRASRLIADSLRLSRSQVLADLNVEIRAIGDVDDGRVEHRV